MGWRVVGPASPCPVMSALERRSLAPKTRCLPTTNLRHNLLSFLRSGGAGCCTDWVAPPFSPPVIGFAPPKVARAGPLLGATGIPDATQLLEITNDPWARARRRFDHESVMPGLVLGLARSVACAGC